MENKVLVELFVPEVEEFFNIYIPINRKIGNVIGLLNKALLELTNGTFNGSNKTQLYNKLTGEFYQIDLIVKDTTIRNGTSLILY